MERAAPLARRLPRDELESTRVAIQVRVKVGLGLVLVLLGFVRQTLQATCSLDPTGNSLTHAHRVADSLTHPLTHSLTHTDSLTHLLTHRPCKPHAP